MVRGAGRPPALSAQRLLAFLALHERALPRSCVAGSLWPDASEDHAAGNLRSTLWRLGRPGNHAVETSAGHVELSPLVEIDLRESAALAHGVLWGSVSLDETDRVLSALSSPLLPSWSEDWVVIERERFCQLRLHALESLCEQLTAAGRHADAIEAGLTAIEGDPLRESAHRALIHAYMAEGNTGTAVRHYHSFRRLLVEELGLEPSPEMKELAQVVAAAATA